MSASPPRALLARDLHCSYPPPLPGAQPQPALVGVDLEVGWGEGVLLLGASGSGKSTLCHVLCGLVPRLTGGECRGQLQVAGSDPRTEGSSLLGRRLQLLLQEPEASLFNMIVGEELLFSLEVAGFPPEEAADRVQAMLRAVGLEGLAERAVSALSGGEKARLAVAAALVAEPDLLLVDEALGELDPDGRARVGELLYGVVRRGGTVLVVESEAERAPPWISRVVLLHRGRVAAEGPAEQILADPQRLEEVGLRPPQLAQLARRLGRRFWTLEGALEQLRPAASGG